MAQIGLTQGRVALVDDEDYERLSKWKWHAKKEYTNWYAARSVRMNGNRTLIKMHRQILNSPLGTATDHINGNGLDNRLCNLRFCTPSQNQANSRKQKRFTLSRYKGVTWSKSRSKWQAQLQVNHKHIFLGRFVNQKDAALAYDKAAKKYFGDFALTNF